MAKSIDVRGVSIPSVAEAFVETFGGDPNWYWLRQVEARTTSNAQVFHFHPTIFWLREKVDKFFPKVECVLTGHDDGVTVRMSVLLNRFLFVFAIVFTFVFGCVGSCAAQQWYLLLIAFIPWGILAVTTALQNWRLPRLMGQLEETLGQTSVVDGGVTHHQPNPPAEPLGVPSQHREPPQICFYCEANLGDTPICPRCKMSQPSSQ